MEIFFGVFKYLIYVYMNVFSVGLFDESEEICIGLILVLEVLFVGFLFYL